jgi:glycogen synthase
MNILVVSNFYPPHFIGGYELGCRDVVDGLRARGNDVQVLTSTHGIDRRADEGYVHRWLSAHIERPVGRFKIWRTMLADEVNNPAALRQATQQFKPDLIYCWNLGFMSLSLATEAERSNIPVCYYVSDDWPARWTADLGYSLLHAPGGKATRFARRLLSAACTGAGLRIPKQHPRLKNAQYCSDFIRRRVHDAGYAPAREWVIPWAVNLKCYPPAPIRWPPRRVLYVGQIAEHKGVHTALAGFAAASRASGAPELNLTLVGNCRSSKYLDRLRVLCNDLKVADRVSFQGQISRENLPAIFAEHDLFIVSSEWDEPFSISLLEAMASGLAVVATTTGGTTEILRDGVNGLAYTAKDSHACAARITQLLSDQDLYSRIRENARSTIETGYSIDRMFNSVDESLKLILGD